MVSQPPPYYNGLPRLGPATPLCCFLILPLQPTHGCPLHLGHDRSYLTVLDAASLFAPSSMCNHSDCMLPTWIVFRYSENLTL